MIWWCSDLVFWGQVSEGQDIQRLVTGLAEEAKAASRVLGRLEPRRKNAVLTRVAASLRGDAKASILDANQNDVEAATEAGLLDKLLFTFFHRDRVDDTFTLDALQTFFEDQRQTDPEWFGAGYGQVVRRAIDGQRTDVATWEEQRRDDETVGRECQLLGIGRQPCGVGGRVEQCASYRRDDVLADQPAQHTAELLDEITQIGRSGLDRLPAAEGQQLAGQGSSAIRRGSDLCDV